MGDINARVGCGNKSKAVGKFVEEIKNDNGDRLTSICEQFELKIDNSFFEHRNIHRYTWTKKTKEIKSVITKQRSSAQVMDVRVFRGAEYGSDHYLVKGTIFWPWIKGGVRIKTRQNSIESREWKPDKFNIQLLQDESIKMLNL
jgi:hypothetical protein